jgi:hypothetical protein
MLSGFKLIDWWMGAGDNFSADGIRINLQKFE